MPFVSVYIHCVFSTKNRIPYLDSKKLRNQVWFHLKEYAESQGIILDCANGYTDHCHCLISLKPTQSIAKIMKLLKGESSHWININKLTKDKFQWQAEYFAVSISKGALKSVREYILNQELHHREIKLKEELENLGFNQLHGD